ncbi:hypothetical protein RJ641_012743, partial [Dillenia turbinata]
MESDKASSSSYYSILDHSKRAMYDAGLYDPNEEEDEGFSDFMDEMLSLMADVKREDKIYSMEELQAMFIEMAQDFQSSQWYYGPPVFDSATGSKRGWWETNQKYQTEAPVCISWVWTCV